MNATAVLDRRESISSSALTAKEEAALVDSFFLPGGILDPDQDEGKEEESTKNQSAAIASSAVEATTENDEQRDSFWSTGQSNSYLPAQAFVASKEPTWTTLDESVHGKKDSLEGNTVQDVLLNPSTSLFHQDTSFNGSYTQLCMVPETEPDHPPLQRVPPGLALSSDPLGAGLGQLNTHKPPPSQQEQEDVRQMVLALSSSLQNIGEFADQDLPDHILRPDSPPRIIRSSVSGCNRPAASIPLEFRDAVHGAGNGDEDDDDIHSTTSSLSSGSACRNDSPIQLSAHYRPPTTSILPQQTVPIQSYQFQTEEEPNAMPLFATKAAVIPPPPGYQPLPIQPPKLQFRAEETFSRTQTPSPTRLTIPSPPPPPPVLSISSPPPSLSIPSPPRCVSHPQPRGHNHKFSDDSILSEDLEPPTDSVPQQSKVESPVLPSNTRQPESAAIRRRSTTTTTTMTVAESPAAASAAAAAAALGSPREIRPTSTASKRRRQNRKQSKNRDTTNRISSIPAQDQKKESGPKIRIDNHRQPNSSKEETRKLTQTTFATTTQTLSKPEGTIAAFDLARQVVHSVATLVTCMIQEALKEAIERQFIAVDYLVLYLAPVLAEYLMDFWVWLPHFFPGVATAVAVSWVCHRMEEDPILSIDDLSSGALEEPANKTTTIKKKKSISGDRNSKNNISSVPRVQSLEDQRMKKELSALEARICHCVLKNLRWSLPSLILVVSTTQTSNDWEGLPCLRLVTAFGLSMLKTYNLFSPLSWISASLQLLLLLGMRDSHTYMKRWCGLEIIVSSLGLSTLRFIRLGVRKK